MFSCDIGADVHDHYRALLEEQVPDSEATAQVVQSYVDEVSEDEAWEVWLALAASQVKFGRLDEVVRDRAIAVIDSGEHLERWTGRDRTRRLATLAKLREQLTGPQKPPRALRKPRRRATDLIPGAVLSYADTSNGRNRTALWRVLHVEADRTSDSPILGWLAWDGEEVPGHDELRQLSIRTHDTLALPPSPDGDGDEAFRRRPATYSVYQYGADTWQRAGFELVDTVEPHPGDDQTSAWFGLEWNGLADEAMLHLRG